MIRGSAGHDFDRAFAIGLIVLVVLAVVGLVVAKVWR